MGGKKIKTIGEKVAQRRRTRENKIRRLKTMLSENPNDEKVKERLTYWENQIIK